MRSLFSQALQYPMPDTPPQFGLNREQLQKPQPEKYLVFLHGTTWTTKEWPEAHWMGLADLAKASGYRIKISGGNAVEVERAKRIAKHCDAVDVSPYLTISQMATLLANAKGAIAVDTGFGHLAAALNIPIVSLYGPTNPAFTGALGNASLHLSANFACAPCLRRTCNYKGQTEVTPACYSTLTPMQVFDALHTLI